MTWIWQSDFASGQQGWAPVPDSEFGTPRAAYSAGVGFVSVDIKTAGTANFSRVLEISKTITSTFVISYTMNFDYTKGDTVDGASPALNPPTPSASFDQTSDGTGLEETINFDSSVPTIVGFIRSSLQQTTPSYSGVAKLNWLTVLGTGSAPAGGEADFPGFVTIGGTGSKPLETDIDLDGGSKRWVTYWDAGTLNLREYSSSLVAQNTFPLATGTFLSNIDSRVFYISPYTPPFFGTANLNDIIYVFGRWDDGSVQHLHKSVDGGSSFSDVGDSATWGAGWVGGFFADDANTMFAFVNGASRALYKTTDGGTTWTNLSTLPFDVDPGGVSKHPDGRILISNRNAGAQTAAYSIAPAYSSWLDATGTPSFPSSTPGAGSNAIIWIT